MKRGAKLRLGVNIDHVATLRQARRAAYPDVLEAAAVCEKAGADGITAHLREDRRHIQDADVYALRRRVRTRLNLEMANVREIVRIAVDVRPHEVCLVPERRQELTTEGGLDVVRQARDLGRTTEALSRAGILVSLFVDADPAQIRAVAAVGAPCVELHTGAFCHVFDRRDRRRGPVELGRLIAAAEQAHGLGLQVNAGHGINLGNVDEILRVPHLHTLNIGHSLVARAVFAGLGAAVREMRGKMGAYRLGDAEKRTR